MRIWTRITTKTPLISWKQHTRWLCAFAWWYAGIRLRRLPRTSQGTFVAILLSYKRPHNIEPIVRSLLAMPSVAQVIVGNNGPVQALQYWLRIHHPRLTVIEHGEYDDAMTRYEIALDTGAKRFLIVDDDLFLTPKQMELLCAHALRQPESPHGMYGQRHLNNRMVSGFCNQEGPIDILNRIYVCTDIHVRATLELARQSGLLTPESRDRNGCCCDDMLMSIASPAKPYSHNIGPYLDCPTQGKSGVALWQEEWFMERREHLYHELWESRDVRHEQVSQDTRHCPQEAAVAGLV